MFLQALPLPTARPLILWVTWLGVPTIPPFAYFQASAEMSPPPRNPSRLFQCLLFVYSMQSFPHCPASYASFCLNVSFLASQSCSSVFCIPQTWFSLSPHHALVWVETQELLKSPLCYLSQFPQICPYLSLTIDCKYPDGRAMPFLAPPSARCSGPHAPLSAGDDPVAHSRSLVPLLQVT